MVHSQGGRHRAGACWCALVLFLGACVGDGDPAELAMYPMDGSSAANPATTISFRGSAQTNLDDLRDLTVTGSVSGMIDGDLIPHDDGIGTSFHPDVPLVPGEEIQVGTRATVVGEGELSFRVAVPGAPPAELPSRGASDLPAPELRDLPTMPEAAIPDVTVDGDVGQGLFLSTPSPNGDSDMGAQITDAQGQLVWWRPAPADGTTLGALEVHQLNDEPVLAWFEGTAPYGVGKYQGEWVIVDETYSEVARLQGGNGIAADLHDLVITEDDTALLVAYHPIVMNLTAVGGRSESLVLDSVVQEIDIPSGDVLFEWHSVDHVPLTDTVEADPATDEVIDYAHINAADVDSDGRVVVSLRHTSQIMEIDRRTGQPVWILGGRSNTVDVGEDPGISYPHHVRWLGDGMISVFDNGVDHDPQTSRGVVYDLAEDHGSAAVVDQYVADPAMFTVRQGSLQTGLPDDAALAMWSVPGIATRFDADGRPTGTVDLGTESYRMFQADWIGTPTTAPTAVPTANGVTISWNGATEVAQWEVLVDGSVVATEEARGFETTLPLTPEADADSMVVRARDAEGRVLEGSQTTTQVP